MVSSRCNIEPVSFDTSELVLLADSAGSATHFSAVVTVCSSVAGGSAAVPAVVGTAIKFTACGEICRLFPFDLDRELSSR